MKISQNFVVSPTSRQMQFQILYSSPNKENYETNDSNNSQPVKIKFGVGILLAGVVVTPALLLER